jgi:hypothetical protein
MKDACSTPSSLLTRLQRSSELQPHLSRKSRVHCRGCFELPDVRCEACHLRLLLCDDSLCEKVGQEGAVVWGEAH